LWQYVSLIHETCYETGHVLYEIAYTLSLLNLHEQAHSIYERSLNVRLEVLGEEHHETGDTYVRLGEALVHMNRQPEAYNVYVRARDVYERCYGDGSKQVMSIDKIIDDLKQNEWK
jgi:hypothetical protein